MMARVGDYAKGPGQCPRFDACKAPICPLDPRWPSAEHLDGERICTYLTEAVKEGGPELIREALPGDLAELVLTEGPKITAAWPDIGRRVKRAAGSCSRIAAALHMLAKKPLRTKARARPAGVVAAPSSVHGVHPPTERLSAILGGDRD